MLFCVFGFTVCAKAEITDEQFDELCMILIDNLDPSEYSIINNDIVQKMDITHNYVVLFGPKCKKIKQFAINAIKSDNEPLSPDLPKKTDVTDSLVKGVKNSLIKDALIATNFALNISEDRNPNRKPNIENLIILSDYSVIDVFGKITIAPIFADDVVIKTTKQTTSFNVAKATLNKIVEK